MTSRSGWRRGGRTVGRHSAAGSGRPSLAPADPASALPAGRVGRAHCHAGDRLHVNKVVAHTFDTTHVFGGDDESPTLSLIEKRSPELYYAVAHDDIDQTELCPALLIQLCQQTLTNSVIIARCRCHLPGKACERMKEVGAADYPHELVVAQDRHAFDAVMFHQFDDVTQRHALADGVNRLSHDVLDLTAACAHIFLSQPPRTEEKLHPARPLALRTGLDPPQKIALRYDANDVAIAV